MCRGMGEEEKETVGSPNEHQDFILRRLGDCARVDIGGYITRFNGLEMDESLFRINPAHVHLAGVDVEQRVAAGDLRSAPVRLLRRRIRHDSRASNLFRLRPRSRMEVFLV